ACANPYRFVVMHHQVRTSRTRQRDGYSRAQGRSWTSAQCQNAIREKNRFVYGVSDHERGGARILSLAQLGKLLLQRCSRQRVQCPKRFVEKEDSRFDGERSR